MKRERKKYGCKKANKKKDSEIQGKRCERSEERVWEEKKKENRTKKGIKKYFYLKKGSRD